MSRVRVLLFVLLVFGMMVVATDYYLRGKVHGIFSFYTKISAKSPVLSGQQGIGSDAVVRFQPSAPVLPSQISSPVVPLGIKLLPVKPVEITLSLSPSEAEERFYRYITTNDAECRQKARMGNFADGGWDVCIVGPYKPRQPCVVYSFGINNDWSFDDAITRHFQCEVKAFDPSMSVGDHKHSTLVWFYHTGIGGKNYVNGKGWKLRTLGTLLKMLKDDKKVIDYLKIDVEYSEWDSFGTFINENVLAHVKQFGFEIHTDELHGKVTTVHQFHQYWTVLEKIRAAGFRKWYNHFNQFGKYQSKRTQLQRTCCYEMVYLNTHFMEPSFNIANVPLKVGGDLLPNITPTKPALQPASSTTNPAIISATSTAITSNTSGNVEVKLLPVSQIKIDEHNDTPIDAETKFFQYITHLTAKCSNTTRLGHFGDGGWEVCLAGQYFLRAPCMVYSFGINNDWSFDDAVSKQFGCQVHAFDPSMNKDDHMHSALVSFHNLGLGGSVRVDKRKWQFYTFGTIRNELKHQETSIDYLKIDIEFSEWETFATIQKEDSMKNVKQLAIEIHTSELRVGHDSSVKDYVHFWSQLKYLEDLGFRLWLSHNNPYGKRKSMKTGQDMSCCYELYYINEKYMDSS